MQKMEIWLVILGFFFIKEDILCQANLCAWLLYEIGPGMVTMQRIVNGFYFDRVSDFLTCFKSVTRHIKLQE